MTEQTTKEVNISIVSSSNVDTLNLAISATFTAEPIKPLLAFWIAESGLASNIQFAPYNQVFQQLLEPNSLLERNKKAERDAAINILLLRLEDWVGVDNSDSRTYLQLEKTVSDFVAAFRSTNNQASTPTIVCIVPASPTYLANSSFASLHHQIEEKLQHELADLSAVHLLPSAQILRAAPQTAYYDVQTDKTGHVPYTDAGFALLSTAIARRIATIRNRPHKVIVLDCDNTLWHGVCGEDGADGVTISAPFIALQQFMLTQKEEGMLLCLCSKNSEQDALDVFQTRSEMPIQLDDLVTWRINWEPKSANIQSLANELQLGLDSFIFLDDNPVECAEVEASCPQVTTLLLPKDADDFLPFLENCWAFDRLNVTNEDRKRTQLYQQNVERERFRSQTATLNNFLEELNLQIKFADLTAEHLPRVSQMTQRTNQFNFTTIRRSEAQLQTDCLNGPSICWVIDVSDRFGDYGIVSTVIFDIKKDVETKEDALWIDTMLLSCRSLGRGVERRIFTELAKYAQAHGLGYITAPFTPTERNQPALNFLENIHADNDTGQKNGQKTSQKTSGETQTLYTFSVDYLLSLSAFDTEYDNQSAAVAAKSANKKPLNTNGAANAFTIERSKSALHNRIAKELRTPPQLIAALTALTTARPNLQEPFVAPQNPVEQSIAEIWCNVLRLDKVGVNDSFAELGGSSLQVVQVHSKVCKTFETDLPITQLFGLPTVRSLAHYLNQNTASKSAATAVKVQAKINDRASRQKQAMARQKRMRR